MPNLILVTGGAGFIGSHLVEELISKDLAVRVLDNFSSGKWHLPSLSGVVQVTRGDITQSSDCRRAMEGVTHVIHLAAQVSVRKSILEPQETHRTNIQGTLNLLEAAREQRVRSVLFASSCAIYGDNPNLPLREDSQPKPLSPYAISKLVGEYYMEYFHRVHSLATCSLRLFNVFGPRQDSLSPYAAVIPIFIDRCLRRKETNLFGDGKQTRDFIYVKDLVRAMVHASLHIDLFRGGVFNVASGRGISILELHRLISELAAHFQSPDFGEERTGEVRHSYGSNDLLFQRLEQSGLPFKFTPFLTAMRTTINEYQTKMKTLQSA